jgi:hypothetical protein
MWTAARAVSWDGSEQRPSVSGTRSASWEGSAANSETSFLISNRSFSLAEVPTCAASFLNLIDVKPRKAKPGQAKPSALYWSFVVWSVVQQHLCLVASLLPTVRKQNSSQRRIEKYVNHLLCKQMQCEQFKGKMDWGLLNNVILKLISWNYGQNLCTGFRLLKVMPWVRLLWML